MSEEKPKVSRARLALQLLVGPPRSQCQPVPG